MGDGKVLGASVLVAMALAIMLGGLAGCSNVGGLHRETRQLDAPHLPDTPLRVTTANGSITVREGRQEVILITAELKAKTPDRLAATEVTAERLDDGTLAIAVLWPDGKRESNEGCSFQVLLPSARGVELRTTNGPLELSGMAGDAVLSSTNGGITVRKHAGPVSLQSSNGAVRVLGAAGPVRAKTSNGSIRIEDAPAAVDAETSNGAVDVALADDSPGPVRVRTSNGSVELRLGAGFRGELSLSASGGRLDVGGVRGAEVLSIASRAARLRLGEGEGSSVQTSNGAIRVRGAGG